MSGVDVWTGEVGDFLSRCRWHDKAVAIQLSTGVVVGTAEYFAKWTGVVTGRPTFERAE